MIELKAHVLKVQRLENAAAERAGLRVRLLDEARLLSRRGSAYAGDVVEALLRDIVKEIGDAAELGLELAKSVESHGQ